MASKSSSQTASSCMHMMCKDALFPVGITLSGPYPPQMTRTSFNRWWIPILWDEEGNVSLFLWLPGRGILIKLTKTPPSLSARGMRELRSIYIPMGCASGFISEQSVHVYCMCSACMLLAILICMFALLLPLCRMLKWDHLIE